MKKTANILVAVFLLVAATFPFHTAAASHTLISSTVVLMDADTGEVLLHKDMNKKMYPASITKVLTALLVVENCDLSEIAVASAPAVTIPAGYAHVGLRTGDRISVNNALYAMMLPSANDAANVLAEHVAGSNLSFALLMNQRAEKIGTRSSNFTNPTGIPDPDHYTTAYDMALITREAIKNATFNSYFGAEGYMLPALNGNTRAVELSSYQYMMLSDKDEYYPDVVGGKIGYTRQAGHTMITVAKREGRTLICVVLGSNRDGKYEDTKHLLNYGFRQLLG